MVAITGGYGLTCTQAEHLLGSLAFAKKINRTMVVPPFIFYEEAQNTFVPFEDLFQIE